jgi:hypothetical protein
MNGVTPETFAGYNSDSKLNTLFDYIHQVFESQNAQTTSHDQLKAAVEKQLVLGDACMDNHDKRINKLENRKKYDSGISAAMGIIGGFIGSLGQTFFK